MSRNPAWVGPAVVVVGTLVAGVAGTASGHAATAQVGSHAVAMQVSSDAGSFVQASGDETALLEYFTFIPQALLLLIAVGLRRYVLDDEDIPWWLDGDALRARVDGVVPAVGRRRATNSQDDGAADSETSDTGLTLSVPGRGRQSTDSDATQSSTGTDGTSKDDTPPSSTTPGSTATDSTASDSSATERTATGSTAGKRAESHATASTNTDTSTTATSGRAGRTSGPVPDRLTLSYRKQKIVVGDGDTVDEEIRAMLRAAGEGDHAKWIDDRHLHFIHDEHGFTLVVDGENPTRLNGERMRPGDRARVYPGDEIELSGVVTLSVERA